MKTIFKFISLSLLIFTLAFSMSACGKTQEIKNNYAAAEQHLKVSLFDPDSLQVYSADGVTDDDSNYIFYKITYNAKNRLGGYSGSDDYYCKYDKTTGEISTLGAQSTYELMIRSYKIQQEVDPKAATTYYLKIK